MEDRPGTWTLRNEDGDLIFTWKDYVPNLAEAETAKAAFLAGVDKGIARGVVEAQAEFKRIVGAQI